MSVAALRRIEQPHSDPWARLVREWSSTRTPKLKVPVLLAFDELPSPEEDDLAEARRSYASFSSTRIRVLQAYMNCQQDIFADIKKNAAAVNDPVNHRMVRETLDCLDRAQLMMVKLTRLKPSASMPPVTMAMDAMPVRRREPEVVTPPDVFAAVRHLYTGNIPRFRMLLGWHRIMGETLAGLKEHEGAVNDIENHKVVAETLQAIKDAQQAIVKLRLHLESL